MHRHGYKGRKLQRETAQRGAIIRGLSISLIEHHKVETTTPKAKEIVPFVEKLITKAKKGDLLSKRQILASLHSPEATQKLVDDLAPKLKNRDSGHLRVNYSRIRRGDGAPLSTVSFVDDLTVSVKPAKEKKSTTKKVASAPTAKVKAPTKVVKGTEK